MKFAIVAAAAMIGSTQAWFGTGHLLVSRIAYDILSATDPSALSKAEAVLGAFSGNKNERDHHFVECATYADAFKYHGGYYQKGWHFIDMPYVDDAGKTVKDFPGFKPDQYDNVGALNGLIGWMDNQNQSEYYTNTVKSSTKGSTDEAYAIALRLIIHYTGDIHQPLHATSRVDSKYPEGDRGGNSVYLPSKDGVRNLHASWDSVEYEFSGYASLPFSSSGWSTNGSRAAHLVAKWPVSSLGVDVTDLNPQTWADQSFAISKEFVYAGVQKDKALTSEYIQKGNEYAEKQLVIAGHRLANLVKGLKFAGPGEENLEQIALY